MMAGTRTLVRSALILTFLVTSVAFGPVTVVAADLGDYRWERRPLLLFAPTDTDPRLAETQRRIEASRCDFVGRDMVLGVVVGEGDSTLDGEVIDAGETNRLVERYAIDANAFTVVLIGKDGGEKLRVKEVPDLSAVYALIDGMPMRRDEMSAESNRC